MDWKTRIDGRLLPAVTHFCEAHDIIEAAFLTGSYARGQLNAGRPSLNVYFVSLPGKAAQARIELGRFWQSTRRELQASGADLVLDCHPYTLAFRDAQWDERPCLSITTKVFDGNAWHRRLDLPPTIGLGWLRAYRMLWGDASKMRLLDMVPVPDIEWYQGIHEALARYRGILDHLPWALPWDQRPWLLSWEATRYAEEIIRDAIPVALSREELAGNLHFQIYFKWNETAPPFFMERYGERGVRAVEEVAQMKARSASMVNAEQSEKDWKTALEIWDLVWEAFVKRVDAEMGNAAAWLRRVNGFV
ncbi:MAG: hypothetical protein R3B70_38935 [Polyangiaceae bacterium]